MGRKLKYAPALGPSLELESNDAGRPFPAATREAGVEGAEDEDVVAQLWSF
jgi:hypothetical protein